MRFASVIVLGSAIATVVLMTPPAPAVVETDAYRFVMERGGLDLHAVDAWLREHVHPQG